MAHLRSRLLLAFHSLAPCAGLLTALIGAAAFIKLIRQSVALTAPLALAGLLAIPFTGLLEDFSSPNHLSVPVTVTVANIIVLSLCGVTLRK